MNKTVGWFALRDWHWEMRSRFNQDLLFDTKECNVSSACRDSETADIDKSRSFLLHARLSRNTNNWTCQCYFCRSFSHNFTDITMLLSHFFLCKSVVDSSSWSVDPRHFLRVNETRAHHKLVSRLGLEPLTSQLSRIHNFMVRFTQIKLLRHSK